MCLQKKQCFFILAFFFASITLALSQPQLPVIFSDQMVFQQHAMAGLWGTEKQSDSLVYPQKECNDLK